MYGRFIRPVLLYASDGKVTDSLYSKIILSQKHGGQNAIAALLIVLEYQIVMKRSPIFLVDKVKAEAKMNAI